VGVGINTMSGALLDPPWYPHISRGLASMAEDLNQAHVFPESQLETRGDALGI